ncbi:MAG: DNA polymerase III subunit beta [Sphingomonadales bacterium]
MKLTIERGTLLRSLGHVERIVERRNTIPILSNVQIEAGEGRLAMTATDLDLAIVETLEAEISEPGTITTPAHTLYDIVRKLPEGAQIEFGFNAEDSRLAVRAGRSQFKLTCLPREDFPAMAEGDLPHRFAIDAVALKRLIDKTRFAISTEETRYYLNGIYIHVAQTGDIETLRAVATDGHRLAQVELPVPDGAKGMPGIIVPRKTVNELRRLIEDFDGLIDIRLSDTKIRFDLDSAVLTSKLIDGTFPDYKRVIPANNDKLLEVDSKELAIVVDRVSTISTEKSRAMKLILDRDLLTLTAASTESGTATEEVGVSYEAEAMEIGFNSRYLLDILNHVDGHQIQILLADSAAPTLMKDIADEGALFVLMPMRV